MDEESNTARSARVAPVGDPAHRTLRLAVRLPREFCLCPGPAVESATDFRVDRDIHSQIAREEEEILAARYARNRARRQSRGEAIEYEAAATPPSRSAPHRRMSVGDRFRQNQ